MKPFITPNGIDHLREGLDAPLWRTLVSIDNSLWLNLVCAAIIAFCVGFIVRRFVFWYDYGEEVSPEDLPSGVKLPPRARFTPAFAALFFLLLTVATGRLMRFSPLLVAWVPLFLALALIGSLNSRPPEEQPVEDSDDGRPFFRTRLALVGALAAVGMWESAYGVIMMPVLLILPLMRFIRRRRRIGELFGPWAVAFLAVLVAEHFLLPACQTVEFMPHVVPLHPVLLLVFPVALLVALTRVFGQSRGAIVNWLVVIVGLLGYMVWKRPAFGGSASERFVRFALSELGERRYVIGDGIFDGMFAEFGPKDLKVVGTVSLDEREFLINLAGDDGKLEKHALAVRSYRARPEYRAALVELGRRLPTLPTTPSVWRSPQERKAEQLHIRDEATRKIAQLTEELRSIEQELASQPNEIRRARADAVRSTVRRAWKDGFRGRALSGRLLALDARLDDLKSLEADAIEALVYDRDDPAANAALGQIRLHEGNLDMAERYLEKGIKDGDDNVMASDGYARLCVQRGRYADAEKWARKAVAGSPDDWGVRQALVAALIELGRPDEATAELDEIERLAHAASQWPRAEAFVFSTRERLAARKNR